MRGGFQNTRGLQGRSWDGRHFIIEEHLIFFDWLGNLYRTDLWLRTDGGSIPRIFWSILAPFGRDCWWSYILHDASYQNRLERWNGTAWVKCTLTEKQSNALLYDAMRTEKSCWIKYTVVWIALNISGWRAFDADRRVAHLLLHEKN